MDYYGLANMADYMQLETECRTCAGQGGYKDVMENNGFAVCRHCKGSGFIPTEMGAKILALVRHNSKINIKAELSIAEK